MRKTNLALARRPDGIFVAPFEQGEIGPDLFRAACDMMLEGLVSKRRDSPRDKWWNLALRSRFKSFGENDRTTDRRSLPGKEVGLA